MPIINYQRLTKIIWKCCTPYPYTLYTVVFLRLSPCLLAVLRCYILSVLTFCSIIISRCHGNRAIYIYPRLKPAKRVESLKKKSCSRDFTVGITTELGHAIDDVWQCLTKSETQSTAKIQRFTLDLWFCSWLWNCFKFFLSFQNMQKHCIDFMRREEKIFRRGITLCLWNCVLHRAIVRFSLVPLN